MPVPTFQTEADAIAAIEAHPVCQAFVQTPNNYAVYYPSTYSIPGGVTVPIGLDPIASLTTLYGLIDNFWNAQRLQVPKST